MTPSLCPLCSASEITHYFTDEQRDYYQCGTCQLVFVPEHQLLSASDEKAQYDYHQNSPHDIRYREFLSRLAEPMKHRLQPGQQGLDFGCGPGPTLSVMLEEAGHTMRVYDYFYAHDDSVFERRYDFITCTETVEHLHKPGVEMQRLWNLLKPAGLLGIMTSLLVDRDKFAGWHYKKDPTHVCFYSRETFQYLAVDWQAQLEFVANGVMIFAKSTGEQR